MKRITKLSVALLSLVAIAAIAFAIFFAHEAAVLNQGIAKGFRLDGYYRNEQAELTSLSFHQEDNNRWQLYRSDKEKVDGTLKATDDPNIYKLIDQSGKEYGFAHLASTSQDGNKGTLYLHTEESVLKFEKINGRPAFFED